MALSRRRLLAGLSCAAAAACGGEEAAGLAWWGELGSLAGEAPADLAGTLLRRSLRVAIHEVGHLFGMGHCQAFCCAMNGVAHLGELDALPLRLCPLCLRKLHLVTGLDPRRRDVALVGVFEALGLAEEAAWQRARARRLWGA